MEDNNSLDNQLGMINGPVEQSNEGSIDTKEEYQEAKADILRAAEMRKKAILQLKEATNEFSKVNAQYQDLVRGKIDAGSYNESDPEIQEIEAKLNALIEKIS